MDQIADKLSQVWDLVVQLMPFAAALGGASLGFGVAVLVALAVVLSLFAFVFFVLFRLGRDFWSAGNAFLEAGKRKAAHDREVASWTRDHRLACVAVAPGQPVLLPFSASPGEVISVWIDETDLRGRQRCAVQLAFVDSEARIHPTHLTFGCDYDDTWVDVQDWGPLTPVPSRSGTLIGFQDEKRRNLRVLFAAHLPAFDIVRAELTMTSLPHPMNVHLFRGTPPELPGG